MDVGVKVAVGVGVNVAVGVGGGVVAEGVGVGVGVGVGAPKMFMHCENSDVSMGLPEPSSLVAVAVAQSSPVGKAKLTPLKPPLQFASVMTTVEPRKCCPSPNPVGSHCPFEKNSTRKFVLATLSKPPVKVTICVPGLYVAIVISG